ncbi:protein translocase subunit SecF [Zhihengliuella salsuginis]|uniref:Protein-export membrane protein SecF n=1 Tax=Zhihengliuella salsuginis TaxID=578222 RepID=A0ABQ3GLW5_9MICC|nr:protein translocase subunit SecF [Zhihengliuella salsuginis]GHD12093.1 protein-export membrane protein SecF [Zhihengliuella salsuginis]
MRKVALWGNELYTGKRSYPFIEKRKLWFIVAAVLLAASVLVPVAKGGFNLGIEFRGGSEFTISDVQNTDIAIGESAVNDVVEAEGLRVTTITSDTVRVQTDRMTDDETLAVADALAEGYGVTGEQVTSTFIGPTWGQDVSRQALIGLVVFIVLVAVLMAFYFRTWKMSLAAIVGLATVVVVTAGIYAATGFEVTPSAIIGFLTILSYALYDTVVVFDKIRENTENYLEQHRRTFGELINLAINQTLVRSINTSVVAILPIGSILFIGALLLGAGTLRDLALALFVGVIVGTLATLFVQAPLFAQFRLKDPDVVEHDADIVERRQSVPAS